MASSTPPPPADSSTSHNGKVKNQPFEDAYRRFFESLSPKEQLLYSPYASDNDFTNAVKKLEDTANQHRKRGVARLIDRIARIHDRLHPFFTVVNVMIQSDPQYSALAWGTLLFVLQLASSFRTFLEKLIATLERLCDEIPQYEHLWELVKPNQGDQISAGIQRCTEKVYGHMFQFFREISNVFTSGGRIKRTPVVIVDILWRPFENRFDGILKQIKDCRSLIEFDILLLQARVANDTKDIAAAQKEIAEKEQEQNRNAQKKADELARMTDEIMRTVSQSRREQLFERIQKWLSPPQYSDALFHGKSFRELGTNEWILANPRFCEWRKLEWAVKLSGQKRETGQTMLWIKGSPGSGKSVLASSIIDELTEAYRQDSQTWELCYFFFTPDCKDSTTRVSAYRSILAQIFHRNRQDDETVNKFDFTMTDPSFSGTPQAGLDELFGLLKLLFQQFQILLILDGIDECDDNSSLIGEIMELSEFSSAKFLLCGRTNTESLIRTVPESSQICLDRDTVGADIRLFTSTQVDLLLDDKLLPLGSNSEDLVNCLCRGADGMFLWAKLMFKYLRLPVHDPYSRLKVIRSVVSPEGIEKLYTRIVHAISQAGETWRDFASKILTLASYSLQPLTLEELYDRMNFDVSNTTHADSEQLKAFQEQVCIVCRGLVEISKVPSHPSAHGILRYIHLSVKEHFSRGLLGLDSRDQLVGPEAIEHMACTRMCLGYILYHVPTRQGQLGHPDLTDPQLGAFSGYAASNWMVHLDRSFTSACNDALNISSPLLRLAPSLSDFLQDPIKVKFWIHILYRHSRLCTPDGISSRLDELLSTLSDSDCFPASTGDLSKIIQRFCQDIPKALHIWDKHLCRSSSILWDEMAIFSESPFTAGPSKGQVISMAPTPPGSIDSESNLVCKMSHTDVDGEKTAVVSSWQHQSSFVKSVVKYDLWKTGTVPTKLSEIATPIEHKRTYKIHPLSISDDLRSFAVLDRLFVLVPNGNEAPVSIRSIKLPVLHSTSPSSLVTNFFKLSAQGRFLLSSDALVDPGIPNGHKVYAKITMFEIEVQGPLQVKPILALSLAHHSYHSGVLEAIFHPSHPIVIVRGRTWIAAWNFAKENTDEPTRSFKILHSGKLVKEVALSSCSKFVVARHDDLTGQPTVLSIPKRLFAPGLPGFNGQITSPQSDLKQDQPTIESFVSLRQADSELQLSPGRPLHSTQILTQANGTPAQLISVQGGEEVSITRTDLQSKHTNEAINLIRLPQGQGMRFTPTIIAPSPGDESIRMILDEKGHGGQRQSSKLPVFISRDINAIKHTFYNGAGQDVDRPMAAAHQQIRNSEDSDSDESCWESASEESDNEPRTKRRKTETIEP